jgi:hypothetical protein
VDRGRVLLAASSAVPKLALNRAVRRKIEIAENVFLDTTIVSVYVIN